VLVVERGQVFERVLATPGTVLAASHRRVPHSWAEERILRDGRVLPGVERSREAMKFPEAQPVSQ
jgi:hypothetical protein